MLVLYVSPTALHSRQAGEWLRERGVRYQERNIFASLLTREEFDSLCSLLRQERKAVLSLFGISPDAPHALTEEECYQILCDAPESLQRPILKGSRHIEVGFSQEGFERLLLQEGIYPPIARREKGQQAGQSQL